MTNRPINRVLHIAVTGSIGSGKSTLMAKLSEMGYKTVSADEVGHKLLFDNEVKDELVKTFGEGILTEESIDRKKLGGIVFPDPKALNKLNSILHPKIIEELKSEIVNYENELVFFEVPLLFEAGIEKLFDLSVNVFATLSTRAKRLKERSGFTDEEIEKRFASQLSDEFKREKADLTIDNSGSQQELKLQLDLLLQLIKKGLLVK
ncbi:MAG: dephospho-CoA kinase [Candidatus Cloacimonas sp.]|nr:dephospho-CoA kinase [Candidatus Cloacimonadota bacterium]